MRTEIFKSHQDFLDRADKSINGVSKDFARLNLNWQSENETNTGCWNCRSCRSCNDSSACNYSSDCISCNDCSLCRSCIDCRSCISCLYGRSLNNAYEDKNTESLIIPKIENIHTKILNATSKAEALSMKDWHDCDTTHCRAGWVVVLAGKEGKELEEQTSTLFASVMIYKKSSEIKVDIANYYESNKNAMIDIKRCADLEKNPN